MAELEEFTDTVPKFNELAENVSGAVPVPDKLTTWAPVAALSVNVSVPLAVPTVVGENVTPTEQVAPALMLDPQVFVATENPALAAMLAKLKTVDCAFVTVTERLLLVWPTTVLLNEILCVENITGAVPVPPRATVCGLVMALSVKVRLPLAAPSADGVNVIPTVQFPLAAMLAPQVFVATANGPVASMPLTLIVELRRLVTVTERVALVLPTAILPKLRLVTENVTGPTPDPLRVAVCVPTLSVMVMLPLAVPVATGEKDTEIIHEDPESIGAAVQVSVSLKGPATAICETCSRPVPVLFSVMERAELVVPIT